MKKIAIICKNQQNLIRKKSKKEACLTPRHFLQNLIDF